MSTTMIPPLSSRAAVGSHTRDLTAMRSLDMPIKDRDARNAAKRAYYERNREACKAKMRAYMKTERGREVFRAARARFNKSEKGRAAAKLRRAGYTPADRFRWRLWRKYRLTFEMWETLLIAQAGRCELCTSPMPDPCVDHRHADGTVRALLCGPCNLLVGAVERDPILVNAAVSYLRKYQ